MCSVAGSKGSEDVKMERLIKAVGVSDAGRRGCLLTSPSSRLDMGIWINTRYSRKWRRVLLQVVRGDYYSYS